MMTFDVEGGKLVIDPSGATVVQMSHSIVVEVPVQLRGDGIIHIGNVYLGTEPLDVAVREAHRWARIRARTAQSDPNIPSDA